MHNYSRLNNSIKQIIVKLIDNMEIPNIIYGQVISENPLQIKIDQKLILGKNQLILTRNVTDYKTEISFDNPNIVNKVDGYLSGTSHSINRLRFTEDIKNEITVYNKLKVGDNVLLLNLKGGQRYLVIDRVGDM